MNSLARVLNEGKSDDEALALELQMVNVARLRAKIRTTLKSNENREFLLKHL